jgi:hypothetical protein
MHINEDTNMLELQLWLIQPDLFFKFVHGTILLISILTKQAKILISERW